MLDLGSTCFVVNVPYQAKFGRCYMPFSERIAVKVWSYLILPRTAYKLARAVFATQGIGWGAPAGGMFGSGEAAFFKNYLGALANPIVFDEGANVADYTSAVFGANAGAKLHCFGPSRSYFSCLQEKLVSPAARLNNFGLSDTAEELILHKDSEISGLASLNQRDLSHLNITLNISEKGSLAIGDEYVAQNNIDRIDLLKMDVGGWEISVLKGFSESFRKKIIKCCQFEFGHSHIGRQENSRDFWSFFLARGYRMGVIKPKGKINQMAKYDDIYENYYATNYVAILGESESWQN